MNMRKAEAQEALNRALSGLQADPWLTQRIIASEKGEEPMKRKSAMSLASALIMLFCITAVAFAATKVYKMITINQKGEIVETQEVALQTEVTAPPEPVTDGEMLGARIQEYLSEAPEDQYVQGFSDGIGGSREPQRTVSTETEFIEWVDGCGHLTRPAFIPEGYRFETATLLLGCGEAGEYQPEELRQEGDAWFARYSIPEGAEIITGYDVTYRDEEGRYINIHDELSEYAEGDEQLLSFPEEYDYRILELPGMAYSIGMVGNGWNRLDMMRKLSGTIVCRWYPERARSEAPAGMMPDCFTYRSEEISVSSNSVGVDVLASMFGR